MRLRNPTRLPVLAGLNRTVGRICCVRTGAIVKGHRLQIFVRDNNIDQALKALKRKMQREGIFREMKRRSFYEKPSEKKTREKAEGIRRSRKAARKLAQREGLLPAPKKKVFAGRRGAPAFPSS
jgi:small subunit ribosomal protein S21